MNKNYDKLLTAVFLFVLNAQAIKSLVIDLKGKNSIDKNQRRSNINEAINFTSDSGIPMDC
jgi:hypothetical protein